MDQTIPAVNSKQLGLAVAAPSLMPTCVKKLLHASLKLCNCETVNLNSLEDLKGIFRIPQKISRLEHGECFHCKWVLLLK
jgi:hypothetical protein